MDIKRFTAPCTITVAFLGESIAVSYRLDALTAEYGEQMISDAFKIGGLSDFIERVVVAWSLTANGEPIPATKAAIKQHGIPTPFLRAVRDDILEDARPGNLRAAR